MMKKIEYRRYIVHGIMCLFLCSSIVGCGVRDAALVFSDGDTVTAEHAMAADSPEAEMADISDTSLICVYVCGAVVNPGVVELTEGSRAEAALLAAGGFTEDAAKEYVNLAAKVEDGERLYFPTDSEVKAVEQESYLEQAGLVNINTADAAKLMTLPGIGEARAQDIIAYRESNGAFQQKEDLMKVSGIKESMYEKLAEKIVVK